MKLTLAAIAALISTSAFAQDRSLAYQGSGTRAGGPAYLLNSPTGGPVRAVKRRQSHLPLAYRGSNSRAGGTAYLLNSTTGGTVKSTRQPKSNVPVAYRGSGSRAGGPAYLLNDGGRR